MMDKDRIKELENQISETEMALTGAIECINKLKCCGNCEHDEWDYDTPECPYYDFCTKSHVDINAGKYTDHWEIKEELR